MTTTAEHITEVHPRDHPPRFWRAQKAALASRGEVDGPRVEAADTALLWHRTRTFFINETDATPEQADALLDLIDQHTNAEAQAAVQ